MGLLAVLLQSPHVVGIRVPRRVFVEKVVHYRSREVVAGIISAANGSVLC